MKFRSILPRRFLAVCSVRCPHRILAVLLAVVACGVSPHPAVAIVKYPITIISGTTTGYVDTLILPPGMIVSNLPGGGVMLFATNLTTGASTIPPFSLSANYATNAGTATFAANAGSLNGLPGTSYLTTAATNGMATNFVGQVFYVSKLGNDSNPGTQMSPFLTISNAVAKLSSNVYVSTTYNFTFSQGNAFLHNLTNQTFTLGSNFAARSTLTWLAPTNSGNQILIHDAFSSSTQAKTNALQLGQAVTNEIAFPTGTTFSWPGAAATFTITTPTGAVFSVSNDMTNYCTVTSNSNYSVTNFVPAAIYAAAGTYLEPPLLFPPLVSLYGAGRDLTIITNTGTTPVITLTATSLVSGVTITEPAIGAQAIQTGFDCTWRNVYSVSPFDGIIGGSGRTWIDHCSIWSHGDCIKVGGILYITDTDAHGIGPQDGFGQTARGNGLNSASAYAWNSTFEAGGNGWNAAVWCGDNGSITNSSGATNFVNIYNCTLIYSNNANSCAISNDATCVVTEYGCNYDHSKVVGPVLHGFGSQTITINATADSSGVVTGYFPVGKVIMSAFISPTNLPGPVNYAATYTGTNSVAFRIWTNNLPCTSCAIIGPSTGYEQ